MSKIVTFIRKSHIESFLGVKYVKSLNQQTNHEKVNFTLISQQKHMNILLCFPPETHSKNSIISQQKHSKGPHQFLTETHK